MGYLMPCPVCGAPMSLRRWPYLEGSGRTPRMVDWQQRHLARTEPHEWEDRRLDARINEIHAYLRDGPAAV